QSGVTTTEEDVDDAEVTVDVDADRLIRVSVIAQLQGTSSGGEARLMAYMDNSDQRRLMTVDLPNATMTSRYTGFALYTPTQGQHTFKVTAQAASAGVFDIVATASVPTILLVEDI